jgi:hypothetical protein
LYFLKTGSLSELVWEGGAGSFIQSSHNLVLCFFVYDVKLLKSVLSLIVGVWADSGLAALVSTLARC